MFPLVKYKDFVQDESILTLINNTLKEVLYECYTTSSYNNGSFNMNLLPKIHNHFNHLSMNFYPILISDLYDTEKNKSIKTQIIKLCVDPCMKEMVVDALYEDYHSYTFSNQNEIMSKVGTKMMDHSNLCPLTLTFKEGQTLKINKILFSHFDCFGCLDMDCSDLNETCDYDYDCMKTMIDYFFTGKVDVKDWVSLAFEINKLGFDSSLTNIVIKKINDITNIIYVLYNTNSFHDFLSKCEILMGMSKILSYGQLNLRIIRFFNQDLDYSIVELFHSSCYNHYIKSQMITNEFFMDKVIEAYDRGELSLISLPSHLMEDPRIIERLNNLKGIEDQLLSKLTFSAQLKLGLKFLKYDFLDSLLPIDMSKYLLFNLVDHYKSLDPNKLKWQYIKHSIKKDMYCSPTQSNYEIGNCLRFIHIHSFNPSISRHLVVFNYIGKVHECLMNGNECIGVMIEMLKKGSEELTIHKRLYIGDYYTNPMTYGIKQLEYIKYVDEPVGHKVNTLLNITNKLVYGSILFDHSYIYDIKVGDAIFVEKEF